MKLKSISVEMIQFASKHPYHPGDDLRPYHRELTRGLLVTFLIDAAGVYRLSLARQGVKPSAFEEQICRQCFTVPDWAVREEIPQGDYHVVRLAWPEKPPSEAKNTYPLTIIYPAASPWLAVAGGQWQRLDDGRIAVTYTCQEELYWSVNLSQWLKGWLAESKPSTPFTPVQAELIPAPQRHNYY